MTKFAPAVDQFVGFTDESGGLLGLKLLFSIFMGKVKLKKKGEGSIDKEVEERSVSLISNIFQVPSCAAPNAPPPAGVYTIACW